MNGNSVGYGTIGYKFTGKKPNLKKHKRIIELKAKGLSIKDIATLSDMCEATVYNVFKAND
jgi:DNA-binding NarL/FixJ family response regulator